MHAFNHRIDRGDERLSRSALDEGGVIAEPKPARPGERRKKPPDAAELAERRRCHRIWRRPSPAGAPLTLPSPPAGGGRGGIVKRPLVLSPSPAPREREGPGPQGWEGEGPPHTDHSSAARQARARRSSTPL